MAGCPHTSTIRDVTPKSEGCEECLALGDMWVELRVCTHCGHVGCCDSSKNRHATAHFKKTEHPIVVPLSDAPTWRWCYIDQSIV